MRSSRRGFLLGIGAASTLSALRANPQIDSFDYVAGGNNIDVFRKRNGKRTQTQSIASVRPAFLAVAGSGRFLFAVNEVSECQGLPAGSVESYAIDSRSGGLSLVSRQPLSLSAIMPRHFAIAPDDRFLVVAAYGGGAYNVLPILHNGVIGRVSQIVKEIGRGPCPDEQAAAHPHSVVFHPSGRFVIGTDTGSDRINAFAFISGRLTRTHQLATSPGGGPADITMSPDGSVVSVSYRFSSMVSSYRFDANAGTLR